MRTRLIAAVTAVTIAAGAGVGAAAIAGSAPETSASSGVAGFQPFEPPSLAADESEPAPESSDSPYQEDDSYSYDDSYAYEDGDWTDYPLVDDAAYLELEAQAEARAAEIRASGNGTFEVPADGVFGCIAPWDYTAEWTEVDFEDYAQCLAAM